VTDVTLSNHDYMNLERDAARAVCRRLVRRVAEHRGEAVLLWHNSNLPRIASTTTSDRAEIYEDLLDWIGREYESVPSSSV
jgi:hypothetical protein